MITNNLSIKFHSAPIYDKTYLKAKVREFDSKIKPNFLDNGIPKENVHYTCIACITIDFVLKIDKKNHPQECKYRVKKIQMPKFINTELKSDSDSEPDSEVESNSDAELMAKQKSDSDSE